MYAQDEGLAKGSAAGFFRPRILPRVTGLLHRAIPVGSAHERTNPGDFCTVAS